MPFPRILIFGQSFNDSSGGGITLGNLFSGWPKERIAVMATGELLSNVSTKVCDTYYQIGRNEYKWHFPFKYVLPSYQSGVKTIHPQSTNYIPRKRSNFRYILVNKIFSPLVRWIGLFHSASKITLSAELKSWLNQYNPEFLYIQVSTREKILFATELCKYLSIPSAIHMMDDWPSTISSNGLFKNYWHNKIDAEFRQLLNNVDLFLSISDAMAREYNARYNHTFIAFHNPIDTDKWLKHRKTNYSVNSDKISLLYAGRIGPGIEQSLLDVASAIDEIRKTNVNLWFNIQTTTTDTKIINKLKKFGCVIINPVVEYLKIPKVLTSADILVFPNDFSKKGIDFLKFSMPTKLTEYMASGTPVLVYAPKESAATKMFMENQCGKCVLNRNKAELMEAINNLLKDKEYRKKISSRALTVVEEKFDANHVKSEFWKLLSENNS